jgi:hypothetical protein
MADDWKWYAALAVAVIGIAGFYAMLVFRAVGKY